MTAKERILAIRVAEKVRRQREFAERAGVKVEYSKIKDSKQKQ